MNASPIWNEISFLDNSYIASVVDLDHIENSGYEIKSFNYDNAEKNINDYNSPGVKHPENFNATDKCFWLDFSSTRKGMVFKNIYLLYPELCDYIYEKIYENLGVHTEKSLISVFKSVGKIKPHRDVREGVINSFIQCDEDLEVHIYDDDMNIVETYAAKNNTSYYFRNARVIHGASAPKDQVTYFISAYVIPNKT